MSRSTKDRERHLGPPWRMAMNSRLSLLADLLDHPQELAIAGAVGLIAAALVISGALIMSRRWRVKKPPPPPLTVRPADPFDQGGTSESRGAARRAGNPVGIEIRRSST